MTRNWNANYADIPRARGSKHGMLAVLLVAALTANTPTPAVTYLAAPTATNDVLTLQRLLSAMGEEESPSAQHALPTPGEVLDLQRALTDTRGDDVPVTPAFEVPVPWALMPPVTPIPMPVDLYGGRAVEPPARDVASVQTAPEYSPPRFQTRRGRYLFRLTANAPPERRGVKCLSSRKNA